MGRKSKYKTGDIIRCTSGDIEILEFISHKEIKVVCKKSDLRVKDYYCTLKNYNLDKKSFTSPYDIRYYGVGYIGEGHNVTGHLKDDVIFWSWSNMLKRCYSGPKEYQDVHVSKDWLNFSNFYSWYKHKYTPGFAIDKDLLTDLKIYSESTCCVIPSEINTAITLPSKSKSSLPIGVTFCKSTGKYCASFGYGLNKVWGGRHKTIDEAFDVYCTLKQQRLDELVLKYHDVLSDEVKSKLKSFVTDRIRSVYE